MPPELATALTRLGIEPSGWTVTEPAHNRWLTPGIWDLRRAETAEAPDATDRSGATDVTDVTAATDGSGATEPTDPPEASGGAEADSPRRLIVKRMTRTRPRGDSAYEHHWTADSDHPTRWNYWAREALAYQSGVARSYDPAGLAAPRCVGVEITDLDAVIALEFVEGTPAEAWEITDYADSARALGVGQAAYLLDRSFPAADWLSRRFIRDYSTEKPVRWELLDDDGAWQQPLVKECFPGELRAAALRLHAERERLYELIESPPHTLCHLDFWTKNLIRTTKGFVLLDWAFVGFGAAGEDIGNLVPDAAFDHFIEPVLLPELRKAVLAGYLDGLADSGWTGDPLDIEVAMAAAAVKYDWLTPLMLERASVAEHRRYGGTDVIGADDLYRNRGIALLDNAEQALHALTLATGRR